MMRSERVLTRFLMFELGTLYSSLVKINVHALL